jgi:hypothetical protein
MVATYIGVSRTQDFRKTSAGRPAFLAVFQLPRPQAADRPAEKKDISYYLKHALRLHRLPLCRWFQAWCPARGWNRAITVGRMMLAAEEYLSWIILLLPSFSSRNWPSDVSVHNLRLCLRNTDIDSLGWA